MIPKAKRKKTKQIMVGSVPIGGGAPVVVQSMTNTDTRDVKATVGQIQRLTEAGCEIVRVAVPDEKAAHALSEIKAQIKIPLIADIHFDHRLAVAAAKAGADALRINPGNIGARKAIEKIITVAKDKGIPIRIGVNSGSLERDLEKKYKGPTPEAMVESALRHVAFFEKRGFNQLKISLKSSCVTDTIKAYELFSKKADYPLHLGVTEAGTLVPGIVKSAIGIGILLSKGIGDTFRVSLTSDPVDEVRVAYEILRALDIRHRGPEIISCPTCGRCEIDLLHLAKTVETALLGIEASPKVAIMGCVVNGPGEAKEADIGIAGGRGQGILFKKGKVVKKIPERDLARILIQEVKKMVE
ncbi:MAG: flavodoxin-dependent (E)-4-hydroxy-3-methylbut-2-enyl-diphosphate synthase [Deltaproteobacteria bacterium]|nr:flavodoxin-dependent (E)-4-hydroxy-3-methylbut-2-enyl-diphosphate synthase [Deltaproteobacteria bacterium]MBW1928738.1 flavodoxin-dependent (E)-4-hydroxy-3-methylbut-2-enyl-diphosphate synthase [Deltaproteobacteria bacterium]MBW2024483.1 flavodoxin-dependent (E)-4-hydroxy-3-methylbut-2-enyl-diphosphate synthase [Deltaproteobacteria bacterium]MBW2124110.1 flavodoxin-dependent (E)-4-hydroxy-3-methylbut-2-enyl-diphosphate synthase [Deltaproteobacteria bacterium]RLB23185.1 MAG: 4-hydroxy-3-methy